MTTDDIVVNGVTKVTSEAVVEDIETNSINGVSSEELSALSGMTTNVQQQIDELSTNYDELSRSSSDFKSDLAEGINALSSDEVEPLDETSPIDKFLESLSYIGMRYKGALSSIDNLDDVVDIGYYSIVDGDYPENMYEECSGKGLVIVYPMPDTNTVVQNIHIYDADGKVTTLHRTRENDIWGDLINMNADTATKAINDGNGNNIVETYATKEEMKTEIENTVGFFTLSVDEDGNLYAHTADDEPAPPLEYDEETGSLYFITED